MPGFLINVLLLMNDIIEIFILALIQGLTEFLPISSSAHIQIPSLLLGWQDRGLVFDVALHFGTLIAVLLYYQKQVKAIIVDSCIFVVKRRQTENSQLGIALVVATIPACIIGLLAADFIESYFRNLTTIAIATILGALLLWFAQTRSNRYSAMQYTVKLALILGIAQTVALSPGVSRSGIVLTMAMLLGYHRLQSANITFLMSIPIIALGAIYQLYQVLQNQITDIVWWHFVLAMATAAISAWLCIHLFLGFIQRYSLMPFIVYRLILGVVLLLFVFNP